MTRAHFTDLITEARYRWHMRRANRAAPLVAIRHLGMAARLMPFRNSEMSKAFVDVFGPCT